jgi:hypothetical protein
MWATEIDPEEKDTVKSSSTTEIEIETKAAMARSGAASAGNGLPEGAQIQQEQEQSISVTKQKRKQEQEQPSEESATKLQCEEGQKQQQATTTPLRVMAGVGLLATATATATTLVPVGSATPYDDHQQIASPLLNDSIETLEQSVRGLATTITEVQTIITKQNNSINKEHLRKSENDSTAVAVLQDTVGDQVAKSRSRLTESEARLGELESTIKGLYSNTQAKKPRSTTCIKGLKSLLESLKPKPLGSAPPNPRKDKTVSDVLVFPGDDDEDEDFVVHKDGYSVMSEFLGCAGVPAKQIVEVASGLVTIRENDEERRVYELQMEDDWFIANFVSLPAASIRKLENPIHLDLSQRTIAPDAGSKFLPAYIGLLKILLILTFVIHTSRCFLLPLGNYRISKSSYLQI